MRFDYPEINVVAVRATGNAAHVKACDEALHKSQTGFAREVRLLQRRVLKRFDNTARSLYAVADTADSCFSGVLLELAVLGVGLLKRVAVVEDGAIDPPVEGTALGLTLSV